MLSKATFLAARRVIGVWLLACALLTDLSSLARADVQRNIEYGRAGGINLRLDASVPDGKGPAVILVHGGGWSSGDKADPNDIAELCQPLSEARIAWFSINYRLAPESRWPDCLDDVAAAVEWVRGHASQYKVDPNRIAIVGYSAGAHLVCQTVTTMPDADLAGKAVVALAAPTDLVADTARRGGLSKSLQALLGKTGTQVDPATAALLGKMSPIRHVHPGLPPFLLVQGTADKSVPYSQSVNFQERLKAAGVPCDLITIPSAPHRIAMWGTLSPTYKEQVVAWLSQRLAWPAPYPPILEAPEKIKAKHLGETAGSGG